MLGVNIGSRFITPSGNIESVIFQDAHKLVLEDTQDCFQANVISQDDFENKLALNEYQPKLIEKPHSILSEYQTQDRDERLKYISILRDLVHKLNVPPTTESTYALLIPEVEKQHPETKVTKHPGHKTICRHWKTWVTSGFDNDSLASKRRSAPTRLNTATEAVLSHYVATLWSNSESKLKSGHYAAYKTITLEENKMNDEIKIASARTFYRRMNELNETEDRLNSPHISQAERNRRLLTLQQHIKTHYALQRVEVDRLHINIGLVDDKTKKATNRLSVYVAIDCYTSAIVGVVIAHDEAENKENVLNLIRHIYLKDKNLTLGGKPLAIIMDNGPGFNNALIQKTCERLNIDSVYNPPNSPSKKPFVESFNKIIKTSFFKGFHIQVENEKSTVGFNSYKGVRTEKGHEPSGKAISKYADVLKSDFTRLFNIFISEYNNKLHRERKFIPTMLWNESIKSSQWPKYDYNSVKHMFHVCIDKESTKLTQRGTVRCLKQTFYSPELKQLRMQLDSYRLKGQNPDVAVYYDPFDASCVTVSVRIPETGREYEVIAYNINNDQPKEDNRPPTSFDEHAGFEPKSTGILVDKKHDLSGNYVGTIKSFHKQPSKSKRSGEETSEFESNNKHNYPNKRDNDTFENMIRKDTDISDRIKKANLSDSKLNVDIEARLESTCKDENDQTAKPSVSPKNKDSYNQNPEGKKRLW